MEPGLYGIPGQEVLLHCAHVVLPVSDLRQRPLVAVTQAGSAWWMTRSSPSLCKRSEDSSRSRRFVPVLACPAKKEEDTFHFPYSSICTSTGFVLQKKKETLFAFHIRLLLVLALSYRKRRFSLSILIDLYQYSLVLQKKTLFTFHTRQFVRVLSCPAKKEHFSLSILVDSYKYSSVPQKK